MSYRAPRRDFLKTTLALSLAGGPFGAIVSAAPRRLRSVNSKLAVAKVACGGMGGSDLRELASHPDVVIVGLCDVDRAILEGCGRDKEGNDRFKDVPRFADYREMYEKLGDRFDASCISTPDHTHAVASLDAMVRGKHVYTQKPLARSANENRELATKAKSLPKIVTQMGTQRSARAERRMAYDLVREGVVGKVKAIHAWTDRPAGWWPSGQARPEGNDPVPANLSWNLWLGPAPQRPFKDKVYAPFAWRGTRDFGTGAFGDMACHILDMPYYALGLGLPTSVHCDASDGTEDQFPNQQTVRMRFAPTERTAAEGCELVWFDGGRLPNFTALGLPETLRPSDRKEPDGHGLMPLPRDGAAIVVGDAGVLVIPIDGQNSYAFFDGKPKLYTPSADRGQKSTNHWHDWVDACLGRGSARAPFELAAVMCEALAVGAAASSFPGRELAYNAAERTFTGVEGSHELLSPTVKW